MLNEGNHSGSGTVINYGSDSGSDFLTSYGSGSGSTRQKLRFLRFRFRFHNTAYKVGYTNLPEIIRRGRPSAGHTQLLKRLQQL